MESRFAIALMLSAGLLAGCSSAENTSLPEPSAVARPVTATSQVIRKALVTGPSPTAHATEAAQEGPQGTQVLEQAQEPPSPRLGNGRLLLLAEIPIVRSDFGVRFAFSSTEDVLLHSGAGLQIQRIDWGHSQSLGELTGFENFPPFTISPSPDGSTIVADDGPLIRVWDSESGAPLEQLELSPVSTIIDAGFQSDDLYFAVDYFGNVALWDPDGWNEITRFSFPGRIDSGLLFSDGKAVALQDRDRNAVLILDLDGQEIGSVPIQDQNAELLFGSPQADRIMMHVSRGFPSEGIKILSISSGDTELELNLLNYRYFAVSKDWDLLAAMDVFNRLRIYSLPDGELLHEQELEGVVRTLGLTMSADGNHLAAYVLKGPGEGGAIQIWGAEQLAAP